LTGEGWGEGGIGGQAFLIGVIGRIKKGRRRRETGKIGEGRREKGLSIEILGPFSIPEQFGEFLIGHNINTFVGFPHPFFKTNDDQPLYLGEIFFKIDKSTDIPGGDF